MAVSVNLFNATTLPLSLTINGGTAVAIAACGPSANWTPPQPALNIPTFSGGSTGKNIFGYGSNQVLVTVGDFPLVQVLFITIDPTVQMTALEIYMWWGTASSVSWVALNAGVLIGAGGSVSGDEIAKVTGLI